MQNCWCNLALFSCTVICTVSGAAQAAPGYHLIKQIPLGAAPGGGEYFDYVTVDEDARRVYLTHGSEVKVLDADTFDVVGTISGLKRCHGVLILDELGKGFITDGQVFVFDLTTLKIRSKIKTPPNTDSIIYDRKSKLVFTFNGKSNNAAAIDPVKETVVKVIDMGGGPEYPATDNIGNIYDAIEERNEVEVIDTSALAVKAHWPVATEGLPVGTGIDIEHRRIFSAGRGPQIVDMMDADSGKVLQSLPISAGVDACVYEQSTGLLFVSTKEGKVHIFHEDSAETLTPVETIVTQYGAKTMNIDSKTHRLFLTTSDFGPAPPATKERPEPSRPPIPGTFRVLIYGR
jgi:hypothetical protein